VSRPTAVLSGSSQPAVGRRAFTLVELLVVITIIGILMSLLMPAIQSAREAARVTQCLNNEKQLALGCLMNEQNYGYLPNGGWNWTWCGDPDRGAGMKQPGGWIYNILPFIEQRGLHDMGAGLPLAQKAVQLGAAAQIPIAVIICPSRRPVQAYPNYGNQEGNMAQVNTASHSDYASNSGTLGPTFWGFSGSDPTAADAPGFVYPSYPYDGAISCLAGTKLAQITDGTSCTYLLGEKYLNPDHYLDSTEPTDNNPVYVGYDWDFSRWSTTNPKQDTPGEDDDYCFGGPHAGGFMMAMCDGSVHSISYYISAAVNAQLCCRNDGQLFTTPPY
jgi:prepilin-type N-terminal cleavage/methylation domain-containing protein/prepilin-type processing-associated H-X9-DG protein